MKKIITLIITLITYTSFSQVKPVVDTTINDEIIDTISVTETNETTKFVGASLQD